MNTQKAKIYRSKFLPYFIFIALVSGFGLVLGLIIEGFDPKVIQRQVVSAIIFSVAWSLICTTILVLGFTFKISGSGINGCNFWGKYRFVEWNTITDCGTINMLGLKYIRVFTQDNKAPIWVPLFLNHMQDFREDIINLTDHGDSIRSYFETKNA